jgi:hypothetical protein
MPPASKNHLWLGMNAHYPGIVELYRLRPWETAW